ncbi:MAG: alpha/beta fold hydrolase [Bacteroidia bacterium]
MQLNYKVYGENNSNNLIILHGLFGMLDNWTTLAKKLGETYRVFTIDQRNHGKSNHVDVIDYETMSEDLRAFMDEQNLYTSNILGHSMGGKTVMHFTNNYPERVERLIIVDIAPKKYEPKHNQIIDALCDLPIDNVLTRQQADEWLAQRIENFGVRQFLLKNLARSKNGFSWKMNLKVIVANYMKIIGGVSITNGFERPVMLLYGDKSNYINNDDIEKFEENYEQFSKIKVTNAGHWVHAEQPDEFFKLTSDFLEQPLF